MNLSVGGFCIIEDDVSDGCLVVCSICVGDEFGVCDYNEWCRY